MAPIVMAKNKSDNNDINKNDNNNRSIATRSTLSREKVTSSSNAGTVKKEAEPSRRTVSASKATTPLSSSRPSSREQKPETNTVTSHVRKTVKTPPSASVSNNSTANSGAAVPSGAERVVKTHPLPSTMLHTHKQASVFPTGKKKKHKTNFGSAYDAGSIPCRINHGGIKNALQWTKDPQTLDFNPLLITCVEGFMEQEHPFVFLSRTMFRELMKLDDASEKTIPILPQVITPLRTALMAKEEDIFLMGLEATRILSDVVENEMNVYLGKLTQQIHRKLLTKQLRSEVEETLATLQRNGGKEALAIIRSKIPTYVSVT